MSVSLTRIGIAAVFAAFTMAIAFFLGPFYLLVLIAIGFIIGGATGPDRASRTHLYAACIGSLAGSLVPAGLLAYPLFGLGGFLVMTVLPPVFLGLGMLLGSLRLLGKKPLTPKETFSELLAEAAIDFDVEVEAEITEADFSTPDAYTVHIEDAWVPGHLMGTVTVKRAANETMVVALVRNGDRITTYTLPEYREQAVASLREILSSSEG